MQAKITTDTGDSEFPVSWNFDEDGDTIVGKFVAIGEAPTAGYGYKPILTLDAGDGELRTVWVFHTSLAEKLRDELARRNAREFTAGEQITIKRSERKTSESTGRSYVPYRVRFPDAPKRTAADVLGAAVADEPNVDAADEEAEEDDIPF